MRTSIFAWVVWLAVLAVTIPAAAGEMPELKVVGVLANTAGMDNQPIPYAFYSGVAVDTQGRVYLCGATGVVPVVNQDGTTYALHPVPAGLAPWGKMCLVDGAVYFLAGDAQRQQLLRIKTAAKALAVEDVNVKFGAASVLASCADPAGRLVVLDAPGGNVKNPTVTLKTIDVKTGAVAELFSKQLEGSSSWYQRGVACHPSGIYRIDLQGASALHGWFDKAGEQAGATLPGGQVFDGFIYQFNYHGGLRRLDLQGKDAPGECGSECSEIRMAAQVAKWTDAQRMDRWFFAGRGGVVEAEWNGTTFVYTRRMGGLWLQDMASAGAELTGLAYQARGNEDVRHAFTMSKTEPLCKPLPIGRPYYHVTAIAACAVPDGRMIAWEKNDGTAGVSYEGTARPEFEAVLPGVRRIGQIAYYGGSVYVVDLEKGTLLKRRYSEKAAEAEPVSLGDGGLAGLVAADLDEQGRLFAASATQVRCLQNADGKWQVAWTGKQEYAGIRRVSAASGAVFVCDTAGHVVDQLDAADGKLVARLGTPGEPGSDLKHLNGPIAVAADPNAVYIADNGNGRILVATTTAWRPEIARLPREDKSPLAATKFSVKLPRDGRLSVSIFDENDTTLRQLACAQEMKSGKQELLWDGRDDLKKFLAPGTYRWHAAVAPKLGLKYVTSVSQSGSPAYRTADGRGSWGGVWGNVADICPVSDAPGAPSSGDIVVLWFFEEGEGCLVRMSQDGQVRWKQHGDWNSHSYSAVACDGKTVYVAATRRATPRDVDKGETPGISMFWRADAETGRYLDGGSFWKTYGEPQNATVMCRDIAVRDGKVYLPNCVAGEVYVADAKTGDLLQTIKAAEATGIAFLKDGTLVVAGGPKVTAVGANGAAGRTIVADAGGPIWDIDVTPDGLIAASIGEPRHQVVFFDATGKEVRALGKKGGRPKAGKMEDENFREPIGLCVTAGGKLFVAENTSPRRFTRWAAGGKFEKQFNGPYYYSGMFAIDDAEPENIYGDTHGDFIRYKLDYATGQWKVDHYWIGAWEQSGVPAKWFARMRHRDGKTYWCSGSAGIVELQENKARGVAAVYGGPAKIVDGKVLQGNDARGSNLMATWSDVNGDGEKQLDEWQVTESAYPLAKGGGPEQGWGCYFDENFDCYMHDWTDNEAGGTWKIPVSEWKNGVPVYRWDKAVRVAVPRPDWPMHSGAGHRTSFYAGGAVYGFGGAYNAAGFPGVGHGHDWEFLWITKHDPKTGRQLWHTGARAPGFAAPGEMYCPTGPAGLIGEMLFWTDENSLVHAIDTQHGLYLDTLLEDPSRNPTPSPYTVWVELFNTRVFRHPKTGKVYLAAASDAIHIFELSGTDKKIERMSGTVTLDAAGIAKVQQRLKKAEVSKYREYKIARVAPGQDVAKPEMVEMVLRDDARGKAGLVCDGTNLTVVFDVTDSSPLANGGSDPAMAFKTGDTVEVYLGPQPPGAARPQGRPIEGDVRLLFTQQQGKEIVVLYRPVVKEGKQPKEFGSPTGRTMIDRVEVPANVKAVFVKNARGYQMRATIPLELVGLKGLPAGTRIGLDFAISFSDPAGQVNAAKMYWGRNAAGMVYDVPSEARLEPDTWGVGIME